jgi:hypothetical protein
VSKKTGSPITVVQRIAGWEKLKALVLDSVSSPITKRVYNMALDEFLGWFQQAPRPGFTKATVSAWRVSLEARAEPTFRPLFNAINGRKRVSRDRSGEASTTGLGRSLRGLRGFRDRYAAFMAAFPVSRCDFLCGFPVTPFPTVEQNYLPLQLPYPFLLSWTAVHPRLFYCRVVTAVVNRKLEIHWRCPPADSRRDLT